MFFLFVFWLIAVFLLHSHISFTFQVVEHCCSNTNILMGETLPGITKDMDLTSYKTPLGVCAGIAPFNFPAMIPLWLLSYHSLLNLGYTFPYNLIVQVSWTLMQQFF